MVIVFQDNNPKYFVTLPGGVQEMLCEGEGHHLRLQVALPGPSAHGVQPAGMDGATGPAHACPSTARLSGLETVKLQSF